MREENELSSGDHDQHREDSDVGAEPAAQEEEERDGDGDREDDGGEFCTEDGCTEKQERERL